jgi:hypothetical protein
MEFFPSPPETSSEFWLNFNKDHENVRCMMASIHEAKADGSSANVTEKMQMLKDASTVMQKYATAAASLLPPYDIKRSQEVRCFVSCLALHKFIDIHSSI